ncbi:MAG TPA: glycosyltransferase family 39 protein [Gemmatimonadaceae bacterium]|nr:glycosyltransferase family 39 protein [Gemmatimonadaceae bacterium]
MEQGSTTAESTRSSRVPVVIALFAIVVGIVLRVIEFARDRPLWLDEAMLGLNIASRSFRELARPLDYDQSAPLLYLWLERIAVSVGGVTEPMLRLFPFIAGVALVPMVWIVARRLAGAAAATLTTVLVALSVSLVAFGAEGKQYGVDPLATVLVISLATRVVARSNDSRSWLTFTTGAIACLLVSQPAVFVLAGTFVALLTDASLRRAPSALRRLFASGAVCGIVFVCLYVVLYRPTAQSAYMRQFWEGTFLTPGAPDFLRRLQLLDRATFVAPFLSSSVGISGVIAAAWALGVGALFARSRFAGVVASLPLVLATVATSLGMYAVMDRLFLFAAPLVLLALGAGGAWILERAPEHSRGFAMVGSAAAVVAAVTPAHIERIRHPVFYAVGKQIIADVDGMARGDAVYVAARSFPLWVYYTTDWAAPDVGRLRWAASIAGAGAPAHNNAASRGDVRAADTEHLSRAYRGRVEIVGLPTGRQYLTTTRTLDPARPAADLAVPSTVDRGWSELEVERMARAAKARLWVFGSHMFALDGAEPALVAELQRRNVRLLMERRQGSTVAYHVEFPAQP